MKPPVAQSRFQVRTGLCDITKYEVLYYDFGDGDERVTLRIRPGQFIRAGQNQCATKAMVDSLRSYVSDVLFCRSLLYECSLQSFFGSPTSD